MRENCVLLDAESAELLEQLACMDGVTPEEEVSQLVRNFFERGGYPLPTDKSEEELEG